MLAERRDENGTVTSRPGTNMLRHRVLIKLPLVLLLEVHDMTARQHQSTLLIGVIIDTDNEAQRELLHKLRAEFQERSEIEALSERYFAVLLLGPGKDWRLMREVQR